VAHLKGSSQALVTRARFNEPKDLAPNGTAKATIATPRTSTTHYIALAVIANARMDLTDVNLVFKSPNEIIAAWDAGEIDGACAWGTAMQHMLNNPWGGSAADDDKGRQMVSASTVAEWDYRTGNVVAASDDFIANHADLVEYLVAAFERTRHDYRINSLTSNEWDVDSDYTEVVARFATLSDTPTSQEITDTYKLLAKFEYLSVEDQLDADKIDLPKMTQDSAYFFYEQKVLAEDPSGADQAPYYVANFDKTYLTSVEADGLSLLSGASWETVNAPIQEEAAGDGDKCPTAVTYTVTTSGTTFNDGSSEPYAYAADADCEWKFMASNYVNIAIDKLMSEQPDDGLEIYDKDGDLLAAFTGRWDPNDLPDIRSSDEATVKWTTNSYDENAIGYLEDVGFQATSSSTVSAPSNCSPGESGASCEYAYCLGVVDEASATLANTIRSQAAGTSAYKANSRCGWRITSTTAHVELKFTELAIENGFDFVKIYEGATAPTGFSLTAPAAEPKLLYAATGSTLPPKLVFAAPVFVTFESDGLGNTAVGATGDGGFAIEHKVAAKPADCAGDWTSPVANCALDHCTGDAVRAGVHSHGSFSSSSGKSAADATDYLAKTTCRWFFEVPDGGLAGLSFRAPVWDVEASGTLTSTTDAVEIYQQGDDGAPSGDAVATLKGGDDPADWDFDFSATSGKFVAVFASDLNNPVPKKGFDLVYAGKYGSATAGANGGFCLCDFGGNCAWPCDEEAPACGGTCHVPTSKDEAEIDLGLLYGLVFGFFLPLLCVIGLVFARYRRKIQGKLKGTRAQLEKFKESVVGMRVVTKAVAPAALPPPPGTARWFDWRAPPPPGTARWYWQESAPRLHTHANLKPPHWVPYDAGTSSALEWAFQKGEDNILIGTAPRQYKIYPRRMKQVNEATGFERELLREATAARQAADVESGAPRPPDVDPAEPCMVLRVGSIVQIARQREDGWAFGSLTMEAPVTQPGLARNFSDDGLPAGWSRHQGWFELDKTDVPTADQLAELQKRTGGADALATPNYWDAAHVRDEPTVTRTFKLNSSSREYKRVEDCFMLTLWDKNWRIRIQSIERIQNVSLWQSYRVKRSTICLREVEAKRSHDEKAALHKYVRCWIFHGCPGDVASKVIQQGFNRSYTSNGKVYGKGVYFARDASYSTYPKYSSPDKHGVQYMFAARAAVGEYCPGKMDQLAPDVRDARIDLLYDSTVDNVRDPSIFVTYHDAQAYPEYLIKFTQGNPPRAHPAPNLPAPVSGRYGRYRPNILADEGLM